MQCPKCRELGLPPSLFCGQPCFKANWGKHKEKHSKPPSCSIKTMTDVERSIFQFTGTMRPGLITPMRSVPKTIQRPDYANHPQGVPESEELQSNSNKIPRWKGEQLAGVRHASAISREVLDIGVAAVRQGVTGDEIDRIVHEACIERGAYPSPLNYRTFPKSLCVSVNEVVCHGIPDSYELQGGDIVNLDVSCYVGGYHGDVNETVFVGRPDAESVSLVHITYLAMMAGIELVKPNELFRNIGEVIEPFVNSHGYSSIRSVGGHGVGSLFHSAPSILHYSGNKAPGVMQEGNVFTVEPMINAGTWHDVLWPDNWTIATKDGKRSAQFEHTVLCTATGYEILTPFKDGIPTYQKQLAALGIELPIFALPKSG